MLEGERSYQRGQENLVPRNNASSAPDNQVTPKAQENPWYIRHFIKLLIGFGLGGGAIAIRLCQPYVGGVFGFDQTQPMASRFTLC